MKEARQRERERRKVRIRERKKVAKDSVKDTESTRLG